MKTVEDNSVITVSVFGWQIIWCLAVFIDVLVSLCFCSTGCHVTQIMLIRVILQPCVYFTALSFCHPQNIFKESCQRNKIKYWVSIIVCWFLCHCGMLLWRAGNSTIHVPDLVLCSLCTLLLLWVLLHVTRLYFYFCYLWCSLCK